MAVITGEDHPPQSANLMESLDEIIAMYRALPPRPTMEEVEPAKSLLKTIYSEEKARLDEIAKQENPKDVPEELFSILKDVRKTMVLFRSFEQKKEAASLIETDKLFEKFDELIQRASQIVMGEGDPVDDNIGRRDTGKNSVINNEECLLGKNGGVGEDHAGFDDEDLRKFVRSASTEATSSIYTGEENSDNKLSLMKVAALIENSAKTQAETLDLRGKLKDQIEWLPLSLGKLSGVVELDISENRIMALPSSIGSLTVLTKFYAHSNQLLNLPESIGDLKNLQDLDLHANRLKSLPASFGNLTCLLNLDLSSNGFPCLPDAIGNLSLLQKLHAETNELAELPYRIGSCASLVEMRLDFNELRALPEAIGKLECLEILTLHYNRVRRLPTTMSNLSNLRELDVSFNELESIPETLAFAVSLKKLNVGKNFADLRELPRSIGNLEMLEELDISDNQIRALPDSFRFLSMLLVLRVDETPLEFPPREIAKLGAQAVVQYIADHVANRETRSLTSKKKKGFWSWFCSLAPHAKMATET